MQRSCLALVVGVPGCSEEPADSAPAPVSARPPGLIPLAQAEQRTPSPHLTEAVVLDDLVYVANSNDTFAIYRMLEEGGLELELEHPTGVLGERRCTTLAVHARTDSLYCGDDGFLGVFRYDISDRLAPVRDGDDYNPPLTGLRIHDLAVASDTLVMARYDDGLAWAPIDDDGQLGELREDFELGNVRKLDVDTAGRVWALTVDRGLLVLERAPDGLWKERWSLDADGPALGLGVDGTRAAVGLGSAGLAIVELGMDGLTLTHQIHPPGVVTAADLSGDAAVAVTLTGVFLYDLRDPGSWPEDPRGEQPREAFDEGEGVRLAGFHPAGPWDHPGGKGAMLDGRFAQRDAQIELVVSDWTWVERFAIDLDGFPAGIDLEHGAFAAGEEGSITIPLRNPTPFTQRVEYQRVGQDQWSSIDLESRSIAQLEIPAETFDIDSAELLLLRVFDGDEIVSAPGVTVLRRPPVADWPVEEYGRPPPGEPFPEIVLATGWPGDIQPLVAPSSGAQQRVVFYAIDCAAMWPEIEDLLWRLRSGRLGRNQVVLASHIDPTVEGAWERWGLADARWGYFAPFALPEDIAALNPFEDLYEDGFVIYELPAAAHHPTDYLIDENGSVVEVEREYRGIHDL